MMNGCQELIWHIARRDVDRAVYYTASTMYKVSEITPEPFAKEAKAEFVKNLGWLLSQTRAGVSRCEYIPNRELVRVYFDNGFSIKVNVEADSWTAIITDVLKKL